MGVRNFMCKTMLINKLKNLKINFKRCEDYININFDTLKKISEQNNVTILDVRSIQEFKEGHLIGAICIPLFELEKNVENIITDKSKKIIVYCQSGIRSKKAIKKLKKLGYTELYNLENGLDAI